jgi:hypothetical protein
MRGWRRRFRGWILMGAVHDGLGIDRTYEEDFKPRRFPF